MSAFGTFLNSLGSSLASSASSGATGLVGQAFGSLGNALFGGISAKRNWKYYKKQANLDHQYNIQTMDHAAQIAKDQYAYEYEMESPEARVKQLHDAGLNKGLAYSGGATGMQGSVSSPAPATSRGSMPNMSDSSLAQLASVGSSVRRNDAEAKYFEAKAAETLGETKPQQVEMDLKTQQARLVEEKIIGQRTANDISAFQYELDKEWQPSNYELNNRILTRRAETALEELIAARNENALYPDKVEQLNATIENILADTLNKRANAVLARMQAANEKYDWQNIKPRVVERIREETKNIASEARKNGLTADILKEDLEHYEANFWNKQITSYVSAGARIIDSILPM